MLPECRSLAQTLLMQLRRDQRTTRKVSRGQEFMRFNLHLRCLKSVLTASCLSFLIVGAAQASIIQMQSFAGSYTITDTTADGIAVTDAHQFGSPTFAAFDTTLGVLTNVTVRVRSTKALGNGISQNTVVSGTSSRYASSRAKNGVKLTFDAPGISGATLLSQGQSLDCFAKRANSHHCIAQKGPKTSGKKKTYTIGQPDLSSYTTAAGSTVATTLTGTMSANDKVRRGSFNSVSDQYTVNWSGDERVIYKYDQHSNGSFDSKSKNSDSLTLNFGTVARGTSPVALTFDIFNLLKTDHNAHIRIGMDYDAATSGSSGDVGVFMFDNPLSTIQDLAAGYDDAFKVHFNTSKTGAYSAVYTIGLTDTRDVAGVGYADNFLTLNIVGNVVPEPGTLAFLSGGLMLLGGFRLRRRRRKS